MSPELAQTLVPVYLTILMAVLCCLAVFGGMNVDKKNAAKEKENSSKTD